jgi:hypothetical protein
LVDVYGKLAEKAEYGKAISHKESGENLKEELKSFLPDFDEDRVYESDIRKLFQWYNILVDQGYVTKEAATEEVVTEESAASEEE